MIKNIKKSICVWLVVVFTLSSASYALAAEVIPLGRTTGMKFFSKGAVVVGLNPVEGSCPAEAAGLKIGDIIIKASEVPIFTNEELAGVVESEEDGVVSIELIRDGQLRKVDVSVTISAKDNKQKMGVFVRDSMAGIGTITFVDPKTGEFGALGHGITDIDTGLLMPMDNGTLMPSTVVDVSKGQAGTPGELRGKFDLYRDQGELKVNTASGVYGTLADTTLYKDKKVYQTGLKSEIEKGDATILSNVIGDQIKEYKIEVVKIYEKEDPQLRDIMIRVTDPELIALTGGIVQGMSGSPIMQNGKIIGAVTHVLVNDPERGYGIAIERMLPEIGN